MTYLELASGLVLLLAGGDLLVRGAVALAARLGLSPLLIGLTIVGFGTSMPELVTSLNAAFAGAPGIALGNVVGSNIANIGLILGLAALMAPIAVARGDFRRDALWLGLATLAASGLTLSGNIGRGAGAALLAAMVAYLVLAYRSDAPQGLAPEAAQPRQQNPALAALLVLCGIAATVLGAHLLVGAAITLALGWQVPEAVIGLTLVAVGTSLPELATSVMAAWRRQGAVAFGNVVGSNIFNLLGILGATALVHPLSVPAGIAAVDVWVMLGATTALIAAAVSGWRITRGEGAVLLALYAGYMVAMALRGGA